ncbi:MAG: NAD(P)H-quinone oxidoreductase subunit 1, chloroplastic [Phycisphaerae bacterium]|nr:NAD(P)H-quinone oxidoreductase subunit 1, chloroplastic [Phycisphaerae bacterium]
MVPAPDYIPLINLPRPIEAVAVIAVYLGFVSVVAMFFIWWERKVSAHMQSRLGPMRVGGWHGWSQSLADGLKLLSKEDLIPDEADRPLFRIAPYLAFVPAFAAFAVLPFSAKFAFVDVSITVVLIFGILALEVLGVILGGWASNSKWSLYGAMREACQIVSYEIPLGLAVLTPVLTVGSLSLVDISIDQGGGIHRWLAFRNPFLFVSFGVFFIASLAANKRAPFDLPESESELVAGFHTEYSGMRFAMFFFAEYAAMFLIGGLAALLYLGGWYDPFGIVLHMEHTPSLVWWAALAGAGIFVVKAFTMVFVQMWLRWTLPRLRIDQVLYMCVKVLLPLACVNLLGVALWAWLFPGGAAQLAVQIVLTVIGAGGAGAFLAILVWAMFFRGRGITVSMLKPWTNLLHRTESK